MLCCVLCCSSCVDGQLECEGNCPEDCAATEWSDWTMCDSQCRRSRNRPVPPPLLPNFLYASLPSTTHRPLNAHTHSTLTKVLLCQMAGLTKLPNFFKKVFKKRISFYIVWDFKVSCILFSVFFFMFCFFNEERTKAILGITLLINLLHNWD